MNKPLSSDEKASVEANLEALKKKKSSTEDPFRENEENKLRYTPDAPFRQDVPGAIDHTAQPIEKPASVIMGSESIYNSPPDNLNQEPMPAAGGYIEPSQIDAPETPVQEMPMQETPMQEIPMQEIPMQEIPMQEMPMQAAELTLGPFSEVGSLAAVPDAEAEDFAPLEPVTEDMPLQPAAYDYVPAYQESNLEQENQQVTYDFAAKDILLAIAVPATEEPILQKINADVSFNKKKGKAIKAAPLPIEVLERGYPLIGAIYSPSGGVGKSSTALNLAAYIAEVTSNMAQNKADARIPRVLVLDGDLVQGSLALRLTGELEPSIQDLQAYIRGREELGFAGENAWPEVYDNAREGEKGMADFIISNSRVPNLDLLAAPQSPEHFFNFAPERFKNILELLGKFYDVIIIDCGTEIVQESQRAWIQHAHELFILTIPETDRLYNAARAAHYIMKPQAHPMDMRNPDQREILPPLCDQHRISVVTSKYDIDSGLDLEASFNQLFPWLDKKKHFLMPDFGTELLQRNNEGDFLVLENPDYAEAIGGLASHLFVRYAEAAERRVSAQASAI